MKNPALCWINGEILPARDAQISVYDHGLLYGDGIFEGLRFYHRKTLLLDAHLERLQQSADAIALELPYSLEQIATAISDLIAAGNADEGYLRLVVTRGAGSLGIDPAKCARPSLFIIADSLSVVNTADIASGIRLHLAQTRRTPAQCLDPAIKSLNYLNNILARIEANRAGMDEALMLNLDGYVTEGTVDNLFIVTDGVLKTPPLGEGLLAGITRALIIELALELDIEVQQIRLSVDDVKQADECFLTGTGAELIPVREFDGVSYGPVSQPMVPVLMDAFHGRIEQECRS
jgi:branched-chain amino acid aminotransferase